MLCFMSEENEINMFPHIIEVLEIQKQQSISGITRELKKRGVSQHRLIVTGYLRAMRDLNYLTEFDLSPSKIYQIKNDRNSSDEVELLGDSLNNDNAEKKSIYKRIKKEMSFISDKSDRITVCTYILTKLFSRPCFDYELTACGCNANEVSKLQSNSSNSSASNKKQPVYKAKLDNETLSKYFNDLECIPEGSIPYEIDVSKTTAEILDIANDILISILKDKIDLTGLVLKKQHKDLFDF